jgi:hypothetical protein
VSWLDFLSNNPPPPNAPLPGRESRGVSWPLDQSPGDSGLTTIALSSSLSLIRVASPKRPSKRPRVDSGVAGELDEDVDVGIQTPTSERRYGAKGAKIKLEVENRDTHSRILLSMFSRIDFFYNGPFRNFFTTNHLTRSLCTIVLGHKWSHYLEPATMC